MWEEHPQQGELLGSAQGMSQVLCVSGSLLSSAVCISSDREGEAEEDCMEAKPQRALYSLIRS